MAQPEFLDKYKIKTVDIPVVSMHGSLEEKIEDDVFEKQALVISHKDMDSEEWIKIRSIASATEFYYYDKILQVPIIIGCVPEDLELTTLLKNF